MAARISKSQATAHCMERKGPPTLKGQPLADRYGFSHCAVSKYRKGQSIGRHGDNDAMGTHDGILSVAMAVCGLAPTSIPLVNSFH